MVVFPLGLGTKLRRLPLVTLAIAALWTAVAFLDHSDDRITEGLVDAVATSGIRDASRDLFVQYCRSRSGGDRNCRKYAVLVWTGFPARAISKLSDHGEDHHGEDHLPLDVTAMKAEFDTAKLLRKELTDCGHSKSCFVYKSIIWKFLDEHQRHPAAFAALRGYRSFRTALFDYHLDLKRLCAANDCLVKGNINLRSLIAAQLRHGGFLHLLGNLVAFLIFGVYVEQRTGRLLYLAVIVAGGTLGMAVHAAFFGGTDTIALGGSADVSAVMGMFYVFFFRARMCFLVWLPRKIYAGTSYFADVRYCFPLLFVLSDVAGGLDNGFADLVTTKVAHFAHLTGLLFGMGCAYLIARLRPVPKPFLFEGEAEDLADLQKMTDLGKILDRAGTLIKRNPENVHALEFACGAFLRWSQATTVAREQGAAALHDRGRAFLADHLATICAINARSGELRYACKLLSLVPLAMPYKVCLGRLGQVSALKLADYALAQGHPILAFRLYDLFLSRFPLSVKCRAVEDTAADLIANLTPDRETVAALNTFLTFHQESMLGPRLGAWLANLKDAAA
jgi:membrane associated rhomboid family serine protease